jgi:hypothetical protein
MSREEWGKLLRETRLFMSCSANDDDDDPTLIGYLLSEI